MTPPIYHTVLWKLLAAGERFFLNHDFSLIFKKKLLFFLHIFVKISTPQHPPNLGLDPSWGVLTPTPPRAGGSIPAKSRTLYQQQDTSSK